MKNRELGYPERCPPLEGVGGGIWLSTPFPRQRGTPFSEDEPQNRRTFLLVRFVCVFRKNLVLGGGVPGIR
jgi:hypothetical protein